MVRINEFRRRNDGYIFLELNKDVQVVILLQTNLFDRRLSSLCSKDIAMANSQASVSRQCNIEIVRMILLIIVIRCKAERSYIEMVRLNSTMDTRNIHVTLYTSKLRMRVQNQTLRVLDVPSFSWVDFSIGNFRSVQNKMYTSNRHRVSKGIRHPFPPRSFPKDKDEFYIAM